LLIAIRDVIGHGYHVPDGTAIPLPARAVTTRESVGEIEMEERNAGNPRSRCPDTRWHSN
jgi:hypothetical protein